MPVDTSRESLSASIRVSERDALTRLAAATGGQSLCGPSGRTGGVPSVKYYEGMVAACAEARRAIARLPESPAKEGHCLQVLRGIRDRWVTQSGAPGRSGSRWAEYLSGGRAACEQLLAE